MVLLLQQIKERERARSDSDLLQMILTRPFVSFHVPVHIDRDSSRFSDMIELEKLAKGLRTDLKNGLSDYEFQTGFRERRKL